MWWKPVVHSQGPTRVLVFMSRLLESLIQGPSACIYEMKFLLPLYVQANPELAAIWAVGQHIWQRDFPGVYAAIATFQWSENILPVMEALRGKIESKFSVSKYVKYLTTTTRETLAKYLSLPLKWIIYIFFSCFLFGVLSSISRGPQISTPPTMRQTRSNNGSLCFLTTVSVTFIV